MNCEHKKLKWYFNEATKAEEWTCLERCRWRSSAPWSLRAPKPEAQRRKGP